MDAVARDLNGLLVEIDDQVAGRDHRLGMALRAADDGVNAGDEFVFMEGLGQIIVGTEAEALHLVFDAGETRKDKNRRLHLGNAERAQHLIARHIGKIDVEKNDVVVVELAEIDAFLAEVGRIDVEVLGLEHQLDALRGGAVVFYQEHAHVEPSAFPSSVGARSGYFLRRPSLTGVSENDPAEPLF